VRRAAAALLLAAAAATAVAGAASSLGVSSARVDEFGASQPATTAPGDARAPQLVSLEMLDTGIPNGKVDRVIATFDESLAAYSAGTAPWTLANVPSGGALASVTVSGTTATLALTEGGGAASTAVGTFTIGLASSASGIRDGAGNPASFGPTSPLDKAGPVPVTLTIGNGGTNDRADQNDTISITWSERIKASTICTSVLSDSLTQTHSANLNSGNRVRIEDHVATDRLSAAFDCGGFHFGSIALGSTAYASATVDFGDNSQNGRSSLTWAPSTATLTLTLGKPTNAGVLGTVAAAVTATYTPDGLLTDAAGNAAVGTASKTDTHF